MPVPSNADFSVASSIAWFYVVANALRGFTYLPQMIVAWRSRDGARSLSLLTWSAWLVANVAAVLYGLVLRDAFFTCISLINCTGCSLVTGIAARRRRQWKLASRALPSLQPAVTPATSRQAVHRLRSDAADVYVARWGCSPRWFDADSAATRHRAAAWAKFTASIRDGHRFDADTHQRRDGTGAAVARPPSIRQKSLRPPAERNGSTA